MTVQRPAPRRPDNIAFGVNDQLPARLGAGLAVQQLAFLGALLVIPEIYVRAQGLGHNAFLNIVSSTLLVSALVVLLQVRGLRHVGAGYYYPLQATGAVLPAMYLVANMPGATLATVFGMLWVVGLSQIVFSFFIMRMRNVFTVEVSGVAVLLIGLGLGHLGFREIFGSGLEGAPVSGAGLLVGLLTFATMVGCNVWLKSTLRLFAPLLGLLAGMLAGLLLGLVPAQELQEWRDMPLLWLPQLPVFGWAFEPLAVVPYMVTGFALSLTSMGTQTIAQRVSNADWVRPDLRALARGVRAEGVAHLFAALFNALPLAASGGAVSLAAASGCTSRYLGYWTAGFLALAALVPHITGTWLLLPAPVIGALLLYLATFTMLSGVQLITSRMLDNRRVLAVGMGLLVGTGIGTIHAAVQTLWPQLRYVTSSGLATGVCVTVLLALLFRLGIRQGTRKSFALAQTTLQDVTDFLEQQGRLWGTRPEPVRRAEMVGWQVVEALTAHDLVDPAYPQIQVETDFDDYIFTILLRYRGTLLPLAEAPPSAEELIASTQAELQMAGYLIGRGAHHARASSSAGVCVLRLTFEN